VFWSCILVDRKFVIVTALHDEKWILYLFKYLRPRNIIFDFTPHILMFHSPLTDDLGILIILKNDKYPPWSIFSVLVIAWCHQITTIIFLYNLQVQSTFSTSTPHMLMLYSPNMEDLTTWTIWKSHKHPRRWIFSVY